MPDTATPPPKPLVIIERPHRQVNERARQQRIQDLLNYIEWQCKENRNDRQSNRPRAAS